MTKFQDDWLALKWLISQSCPANKMAPFSLPVDIASASATSG